MQPEHIRLFVSIPPPAVVTNAVGMLKGTTARRLFQTFPAPRKRLRGGRLRSPLYYIGTAGDVSADTVRRQFERSVRLERRRQAMRLTASVKLATVPERSAALPAVRAAYADACARLVPVVRESRVWNSVGLHKLSL
jgi:putative transposase